MVKGYDEISLWDISGLDMSRVGVETSAIIAGMALIGQLSSEAMEKEIVRLKKIVTQTQNELTENVKRANEDKERSLEELNVYMEAKHDEGKKKISESHSCELEELQVKIESCKKSKILKPSRL